MRGITEERLIVWFDLFVSKGLMSELEVIRTLLDECKELNQWKPIESAPLNKPIRMFKKVGYQCEGIIMVESHKQFFTHWQELPADPKYQTADLIGT